MAPYAVKSTTYAAVRREEDHVRGGCRGRTMHRSVHGSLAARGRVVIVLNAE
jgi:hypothetical protein